MKPTTYSSLNPRVLTMSASSARVIERMIMLLIASVFLLASCKKEPEIDPGAGAGAIVAVAGPDQPVQVGQTITLDGSASKDSQGKPLTYQWTIVRKPAKSNATLSDPASFKPTFKADEIGEYEFELTVSSANGKATDRVIVGASASEPLAINASITVKTTLIDRVFNPELPDYIVTKNIDVSHELTINPGVVIAFEHDVRLNVSDPGGRLIAKGTAENRIKFVGVQKTKGYWVGISHYSGSNTNVLEYVDVMHAGSRPIYSTTKSALYMSGGSRAQIALKNCTFSQNDGYGVYVYEGAILREFEKNAFTSNTESGMLVDAPNVVKLDEASTFTGGNGRNIVEIYGSSISGKDEIAWAGFADKTPYRIVSELTINSGFKVNPGVTLEMGRDAIIRINTGGYLIAKGTATEKVIFTGADRTKAYWKGIMCYSQDSKNLLENVEVNNAGSNVIVSGKKANIALYGNRATLVVKNSRISGSGGLGVYASNGTSVNTDIQTVNTFDSNAGANVLIDK